MLTTKLKGGLGNQLFQLAAGEHIAKETQRMYYIEDIRPTSAHSNQDYFQTIFKHWKPLYNPIQGVVFTEPNFEYIDWLPHLQFPVVCLDGYFQNWMYVSDDFKNHLSFDTSIVSKYSTLSTSAFIHIRGGDYKNHWLHDVNLDSYYSRAIHQFPLGTHFYLFTNDVDYAIGKPFLKTINYTIVNEDEVNSLYLMSQCSVGGICANSSFSWWGAYLNPNRKLVMPSKWFNDPNIYTNGYYFNGVTKLDV